MGGCATKPKVEEGKLAPAPVEDRAEDDAVVAATTKDEEALSRRQSLSNLLNNHQVAEENDKSEPSNVEKVAQISRSPKQEEPSDSTEQVPTVVIGTADGLKAELTEAEVTELPAAEVVISEILNRSDADTKAPETLTNETPKPSEVIVTEALPKPSDVTKEAATTAAPQFENPKASETECVPPVVEVLKSEIIKPSDAPVLQKTETLEPPNATKTEDANTLGLEESSKTKDASDEEEKKESSVEVK